MNSKEKTERIKELNIKGEILRITFTNEKDEKTKEKLGEELSEMLSEMATLILECYLESLTEHEETDQGRV